MQSARLAAVLLVLAVVGSGCLMPDATTSPRDYIQSKTYRSWTIEVDAQSGAEPSQALLDFLDGRLTANVAKPEGVSFQRGAVLSGASQSWSTAEIVAYSAAHRDEHAGGSKVTTHLLFLRGGTEEDSGNSRVLGVTIGHDLIAIFPDNIAATCTTTIPLNLGCSTDPIAEATTLHEFGHALGLVNHGTPMVRPHEASTCNDKPDKAHSSNRDSVMYCAVETNQIAVLFGSNPPDDFDADDKADLRAVREK